MSGYQLEGHFCDTRINLVNTPKKLQLKSEVGLIGAVSLIAGIFMSPQTVLQNTGSPGATLLIWAAGGVLSVPGSQSYAELGTVIQESGGKYIYILGISGDMMAFIFAFTSLLVVRPSSMCGLALSFAHNAGAPFYYNCAPPALVRKSVAACGLMLLAIITCLNVRYSMTLRTSRRLKYFLSKISKKTCF